MEKIKAWAIIEKGKFQSARLDKDKARYMVSVQKKYGVKQRIVQCEVIIPCLTPTITSDKTEV